MLSESERKTLINYLNLAPSPEDSFSYDELLGYIFGLAMTPDIITPSEWQPLIFAGDNVEFSTTQQAESMTGCLIQALNNTTKQFHQGELVFPFEISSLNNTGLEQLYEWVSGFEEALFLREEIWDPEENSQLSERKKEELYHSLMTIQGLVDPLEVMDFFDKIPTEVFQEAFPDMAPEMTDREAQVQLFLLSSLPLAVSTLMKHAQTKEKDRQQQMNKSRSPKPSNVIEIDFRRERK